MKEKSYAMGYQDGLEDGLQGIRLHCKWIKIATDGIFYYECPNCRHIEPIMFNFCANCGVDMREEI